MSGSLQYLYMNERRALDHCAIRLYQTLGEQVVGLWLFGSKSRGDYDADSDIDLLAIIRTMDWNVWHLIRMIAAECSLEYDVLFNVHIVDTLRWNEETRCHGTLWRAVQRDGVSLVPETALVARQ